MAVALDIDRGVRWIDGLGPEYAPHAGTGTNAAAGDAAGTDAAKHFQGSEIAGPDSARLCECEAGDAITNTKAAATENNVACVRFIGRLPFDGHSRCTRE